jgi:hypothetical protein
MLNDFNVLQTILQLSGIYAKILAKHTNILCIRICRVGTFFPTLHLTCYGGFLSRPVKGYYG